MSSGLGLQEGASAATQVVLVHHWLSVYTFFRGPLSEHEHHNGLGELTI